MILLFRFFFSALHQNMILTITVGFVSYASLVSILAGLKAASNDCNLRFLFEYLVFGSDGYAFVHFWNFKIKMINWN